MNIDVFIEQYKPEMSEYCPIVIDLDGAIHECPEGHLKTLKEMIGDESILLNIPDNVSPLLFLVDKLKCIVVDYENQIYMDELTEQQDEALNKLVAVGLIKDHRIKMTAKSLFL